MEYLTQFYTNQLRFAASINSGILYRFETKVNITGYWRIVPNITLCTYRRVHKTEERLGDMLCPWGRDPASQDDAGLELMSVSGIAHAPSNWAVEGGRDRGNSLSLLL